MGDFESAFGAGADVIGIIDGFSASEHARMSEDERAEKLFREARQNAFSYNQANKQKLQRDLTNSIESGCLRTSADVFEIFERGARGGEDTFNLPSDFVDVVGAIFTALRCDGNDDSFVKGQFDDEAAAWLVDCVSVIGVGSDLRLVVPGLLASITDETAAMLRTNAQSEDVAAACEPGGLVIRARAQGLFAPEDVAFAAARSAWATLSRDWNEGNKREGEWAEALGSGESTKDFVAEIIGSACYPKLSGSLNALRMFAKMRDQASASRHGDGWNVISCKLIEQIHRAAGEDGRDISRKNIFVLDDIADEFQPFRIDPSYQRAFVFEDGTPDETTYNAVLAQLREDRSSDLMSDPKCGGFRSLERVLERLCEDDANLKVPKEIMDLFDRIFDCAQYDPENGTNYNLRIDINMCDSIIECVEAMKTGTDLRLVVPKLRYQWAAEAYNLITDTKVKSVIKDAFVQGMKLLETASNGVIAYYGAADEIFRTAKKACHKAFEGSSHLLHENLNYLGAEAACSAFGDLCKSSSFDLSSLSIDLIYNVALGQKIKQYYDDLSPPCDWMLGRLANQIACAVERTETQTVIAADLIAFRDILRHV